MALLGMLVLPSRVWVPLRLCGGPSSARPQFSNALGHGPIVMAVPFPLNSVPMQVVPLNVTLTVPCICMLSTHPRRAPTVTHDMATVPTLLIPRPGLPPTSGTLLGPGHSVTRYLPVPSPRRCMPPLAVTVRTSVLVGGPLRKQLGPVPKCIRVLPVQCRKINGLALTGPPPRLVAPPVPNNRLVHLVEQTEENVTVMLVRNGVLWWAKAKAMAPLLIPLMSPSSLPKFTSLKHGKFMSDSPRYGRPGLSRCRKS